MTKFVAKTAGWVFALFGTAFIIRLAVNGRVDCPDYYNPCETYDFIWWTLALEWFCLVLFGALDFFGELGRAYVAMTGLFVYASTQMQAVLWEIWDNDFPHNNMFGGYGLLFGANLFLAMGMGLEHYVQPKLSDDKAPLPVDIKAGGEVRSMAAIRRNGELLMTVRRWLGLVLACVGVGGMIMALVLHDKFCENHCTRNWWMYPVQLFAFAAYIVTEVILEVPSFRPFLTILLATQIGVLEEKALKVEAEGSNYGLQVAGVIIAISVSYILFLTLPGPVTSGPSSGRRTLLLGVVPTIAALVGVIITYVDIVGFAITDLVPLSQWHFAQFCLALFWIMMSYVEKVPFLSNFRLPLVAFIASAIQFQTSLIHSVRADMYSDENELPDWIDPPIVTTASFVVVILVLGTSWEEFTGLKSRLQGRLTSLSDGLKW